jgi:probable HAF family extracellular repeat protein
MKSMPSLSVLGCVLVGSTWFTGCVDGPTEESETSKVGAEFTNGSAESPLTAVAGNRDRGDVLLSEKAGRVSVPTRIAIGNLIVEPQGPMVTTERGGSVTLGIRLASQPTAPVTVSLSSEDSTEGVFSKSVLKFSLFNWSTTQTTVLRGVSDLLLDGNVRYEVSLRTASLDRNFSGLAVAALVVNEDGPVFHGLGDLADGAFQSTVSDVSSNGSVVVGTGTDATGARAFRWTPTEGMMALDGVGGTALGVSPNGSWITGSVQKPADYPLYSAALWQGGVLSTVSNGVLRSACNAQAFPGVEWLESGNAVTDSGKVVGAALDCGTGKHLGYLWIGAPSSVVRSPSVLNSVATDGLASVGITAIPKMYSYGVLYGSNPGAAGVKLTHPDLLLCPGLNPICQTAPVDLSFDGQTIVGSITIPPNAELRAAARWTADGRGYALPNYPAEASRCQALGVNGSATADNTVIVGSCTTSTEERAVIWSNGTATSVEAALAREGVTIPAGWKLLSAKAASSDGRVIVGNGLNPSGKSEAWRVVLPHLLSSI